jgi:hypothetical protein
MTPIKTHRGGGSGGGTDTRDEARFFDGTFSVIASSVHFTSRTALPPVPPGPCAITLLSSDITEMLGTVNLRGMAGVRITSGPPPLPATVSDSTNGIEIEAGELQNVTIKRGLIDGVDQKMEMTPGAITIDGGIGAITIQSLTQIKLSVCGGLSSITLGPDGITIEGLPLVKIN